MRLLTSIISVGLASALLFAMATEASAGRYSQFVTAKSRYGNGIVRAPVRIAQFGYQVRLPGGAWIYCEKNSLFFDRHRPCGETLRRESIDFWETRSEDGPSK